MRRTLGLGLAVLLCLEVTLLSARLISEMVGRIMEQHQAHRLAPPESPSPPFVPANLRFRYVELFTMQPGLEASGFSINALGFRDGLPYRADSRQLWLFGGSVAMGLGLHVKDTLGSRLEAMLNREVLSPVGPVTPRPWRVVNYAMGSQESWQSMLILFERLVAGERPDAILFLDGVNETPGPHPWMADSAAIRWANEHPLTRAWQAARDASGLVWAARWVKPSARRPVDIEPVAAMDAMIARYALTVGLVRTWAEALGVPVVFAWQPALAYEVAPSWPRPERPEEVRSRLLTEAEYGLWVQTGNPVDIERHRAFRRNPPPGVHDLSDVFLRVTEAINEPLPRVWMDPRHPNAYGTGLMATALIEPLWRAGIR